MRPFVSILIALICAVSDAGIEDVLTPEEYLRVMKGVITGEDLVRTQKGARSTRDSLLFALHPDIAAGACGDVMDTTAFALHVQGVPYKQMQFFQLRGEHSLLGPNAFRHVVMTYETIGKDGKPVLIMIDPSFAQLYTKRGQGEFHLRYEDIYPYIRRSVMFRLSRTKIGQGIMHDLERDGCWIVTEEKLQIWADAMVSTADQNLLPRKSVNLKSLSNGTILIMSSRVEDMATEYAGLTREGFKIKLDSVDIHRIRMRTFLADTLGTQRIGSAYLDAEMREAVRAALRVRRQLDRARGEMSHLTGYTTIERHAKMMKIMGYGRVANAPIWVINQINRKVRKQDMRKSFRAFNEGPPVVPDTILDAFADFHTNEQMDYLDSLAANEGLMQEDFLAKVNVSWRDYLKGRNLPFYPYESVDEAFEENYSALRLLPLAKVTVLQYAVLNIASDRAEAARMLDELMQVTLPPGNESVQHEFWGMHMSCRLALQKLASGK